ncbi:MAG: (E)-4-hydroxy-3-methylbut-2-enyl-diphosphate synthase [Verrucomicrobiota bacterium]|nr:(E)-4-hydroxy-3-methylbut-2-enyl-diphosphate synthase [Verrucomicrobiota bacterium]
MNYCVSTFRTVRRPTREVKVGGIGIGGINPIRIQSMTTTDTRDIEATGRQIIALAEAGCEIARVTVQGRREAESCAEIKNFLAARGCQIPLVADIHFYPPAALLAAESVDKVRINPGNFLDRRATFQRVEYDEVSYLLELERLEEGVMPLVEKCKRLRRAIRIGTNHGSLSDRILSRYGDTPRGMVESALEFARIFRKAGFHDFLFSMKSSHPVVMIHAYRLLVAEMMQLGWDYPLHLGVTEAGEGMDGRIKSAIGTGSLLLDGLGDTIRFSLTEDPVEEIAPARALVRFFEEREGRGVEPFVEVGRDPFHFPDKTRFVSLFLKKEKGAAVPEEEVDGFWDGAPDPNIHFVQPKHSALHEMRAFLSRCREEGDERKVVLVQNYEGSPEDFYIRAGAEIGALLADGLLDGICITGPFSLSFLRTVGYALLQAAGKRSVKTEFISCPGCGRTLFPLQETARRIRERTGHLPGVKIAVMGCIVNGPGEMADADFGYVGSKPGKVDLYVGKERVLKDVDAEEADEQLVALIKAQGKWREKV